MAAALKALAGDEGGILALNIVRLDTGPGSPQGQQLKHGPGYSGGCGSSLALEESKGSDLGNSFDNSHVDPDNPYGGECGSSLGLEETDARDYQDPMDYYGGGSDLS